MSRLAHVVTYGRMIKFEHSIFALPFALASALVAAGGWPAPSTLLWIVVAMVGARSAAMGFNRLADQTIDARNPRTAGRELPRGALSRAEVWAFVLLSAGALVLASAMLNPLCLALSPVALLVVLGYSYTKRFTSLSHLVLGLGLGIAPVGAWLAVRGRFDAPPLVLCAAVLAWVGGFDVIYACQDVEFDRATGLRSVPARLGVARALRLATACHFGMVLLLAALPWVFPPLGWIYGLGVAAVALLLIYEHSLVRPDDLDRVNVAFFNVNAVVSIGLLAVTSLDLLTSASVLR
jgi:4-hydroxybenzoate polyprenyltransferase